MAKKKIKAPKKNTLSAAQALRKLKQGNRSYLGHDPINYQTEQERGDFWNGQEPYAAIVSCADSRVSPEIMFNKGLDELFVIRVAGNIATTEAVASIEYAVAHLNTNLIVVVGHEKCGAVQAALDVADTPTDLGYNLNSLVAHIAPAVAATPKPAGRTKKAQDQRLTNAVKTNAKLAANELRERSKIIRTARGVKIVWAYYHLVAGEVEFSDYI